MNVMQDVLHKVVLIALEDWGMMLVEERSGGPEIFDDSQPLFMGTMTFRGIIDGTLSLVCQRRFMENLCRNLLAREGDDEVLFDEAEDALKELTNILCGNFLTEAYGDDVVFELVSPMVCQASKGQKDWFFSQRLIETFEADDEPVSIALGSLL